MLLTVIAVATLLVAVVGATFAYFSITNTSGLTNSSVVTGQTTKVGTVALTGGVENLYLKPTSAQMTQDANAYGNYYATTADEEPVKGTAQNHSIVKAVLTAAGEDDANTYTCKGTLKVTVADTDSEENKKLNAGDGFIVFTFGSAVTINGVTTASPIDLTEVETTFDTAKDVTFTLNKTTTQEEIKADVYLVNKDSANQAENLAGAQFTVTIDTDAFVCTAK